MTGSNLPMDGVRVLDLTRLLPGGLCSMLLGDFGADVIKVEDTGAGDYVRWVPPTYGGADHTASGSLFVAWNRNKRSVQIDLKRDAGRAAFLRLARSADVVVESFRPGVTDRLGVGYEDVRAVNERVVYCSITGYGQTGPYQQRAGHDLNYIAGTGMLDLSGDVGGPPVQPAVQVADVGGGSLLATIGILLALHERANSGRGQFVDTSMFDGAFLFMSGLVSQLMCDGKVPERGLVDVRGGIVCYASYECADGWVSLAAIEPKFWRVFCEGVERPDLLEHGMDAPGGWAADQLRSIFAAATRAYWDRFAETHECCLEVIYDLREAVDRDLVAARNLMVTLDHPGTAGIEVVGNPIALSRSAPSMHRRPPPALGEHTRDVLSEAGYDEGEITALLGDGTCGQAGHGPAPAHDRNR